MNRELFDRHRDALRASAISDDVSSERGYFSLSREKELRLLGFTPALQFAPTLVVPVHGVLGEPPWYMHRPDETPIKDGKPRKYLIPAKRELSLDVPPRARVYMRDPEPPLFVTEGARRGTHS